MKRQYESILYAHLKNLKQMIFLGGARQVGKTTLAKILGGNQSSIYLNWDNPDDRAIILHYTKIVDKVGPKQLNTAQPIIIFDEIHKYSDWKNHLKGFYDTYGDTYRIIVTGSSKLDTYKKGGDSMMGRYFPYTIHPLSVRETISPQLNTTFIQAPEDPGASYDTLFTYGGFPDPYLKCSQTYLKKWQNTRHSQLFREDIRDLTNIREISQLELLAKTLVNQVGQQTHFTSLSKKIRVADNTIRAWINILESSYYCFMLRPWSNNVARSLLKDPKPYLWDWSEVTNIGARFENFIASHLLKAIDFWHEQGMGRFSLHYLRDKSQREVDFIVIRDDKPWFIVAAKISNNKRLSSHLEYFQSQLGCKHAFQVVHDMDYVDANCFEHTKPLIVPAKTFLSQLV